MKKRTLKEQIRLTRALIAGKISQRLYKKLMAETHLWLRPGRPQPKVMAFTYNPAQPKAEGFETLSKERRLKMKAGSILTYTGEDTPLLKHGQKYRLKFDVFDEIVCIYTFGLFHTWINIDETDLLD